MQTRPDVADNTGAKQVQCIKVLGGTHCRYAGLGDRGGLRRKAIPGSEVKPGTIVKGVIVRVKNTRWPDGSTFASIATSSSSTARATRRLASSALSLASCAIAAS